MMIVLYDENKVRAKRGKDLLEKKGLEVLDCITTDDFFSAINEKKVDQIIVDYKTWLKSKPILKYFDYFMKVDDIPLIIYNASENVSAFKERTSPDKDRFFSKDIAIEDVISEL